MEKKPEKSILRLSDAFSKPPNTDGTFPTPALECQALVLNINYGHNRELMEKCKPLLDYSRFISYIRDNINLGYTPQTSVNLAVDRCIQEDVLTDVLKEHRQEVVAMFLDEYDDEIFTKRMYKAIAKEAKEEGWKEGRQEGWQEGRQEGWNTGSKAGLEKINRLNQLLLRDNRQDDLLKSISDPDFQKQLLEEYNLFSQDSSDST